MVEMLQEHAGVLVFGMAIVIVFWIGLKALQRSAGDKGKLPRGKIPGERAVGKSEDDVDPLTEAEVYLSFGRKEQAIEILEAAIKLHPARRQEFETRIRDLRGDPKPVSPVTKL